MKKTFKILAVAFAVLSMGAVMTSCDEDSTGGLIDRIINLLRNTTYTYSGSGEAYTMNDTNNGSSPTPQWKLINDDKTALTNAIVTVNSGSNTASIALPTPINDGKATITEVVIYDLVLNNDDPTKTKFEIGETSSIVGTLKIGSNTYEAKTLYIEPTTYVTTTNIDLGFSIYFDDDDDGVYTKVVNFTYQGTAQTTE